MRSALWAHGLDAGDGPGVDLLRLLLGACVRGRLISEVGADAPDAVGGEVVHLDPTVRGVDDQADEVALVVTSYDVRGADLDARTAVLWVVLGRALVAWLWRVALRCPAASAQAIGGAERVEDAPSSTLPGLLQNEEAELTRDRADLCFPFGVGFVVKGVERLRRGRRGHGGGRCSHGARRHRGRLWDALRGAGTQCRSDRERKNQTLHDKLSSVESLTGADLAPA